MLKPVLLILHQEHSSPGRVGQVLGKLGYPLDIRRPRFGDPLPETMDEHAGAAIFGGPQSANDEEDFVKREIDWIGVPLRDKKPYLGICLGAQMMARHLGGRVLSASARPCRSRLLPDPPDASRAQGLRRLAGSRLSMASRGLRPAGRRRIAGRRRRRLFRAGVPLWHRLCAAVPPRGHPRHDVSLAGARRPPHGTAGHQAARTSTSPTARCTIMPRATGSPPSSITGSGASRSINRPLDEKPAFALRAMTGNLRM